MTRVTLIGLGEGGTVFAEDLAAGGHTDLVAWDIAFADLRGASKPHGASLNDAYIGAAAASYWLIGGSPSSSSMVRSIELVV